jgi:hypothetical protein
MKKLEGLQLINELSFNNSIKPTAVHLITESESISKNLIVSGDKAGQVCLFEFGEKTKPSVEFKPESLIEITVIENMEKYPNVITGIEYFSN